MRLPISLRIDALFEHGAIWQIRHFHAMGLYMRGDSAATHDRLRRDPVDVRQIRITCPREWHLTAQPKQTDEVEVLVGAPHISRCGK